MPAVARYRQVQALASTALSDPLGAYIQVSAAAVGSMEAARSHIRSFQQTFNAWRAQDRKAKRKTFGAEWQHPADELVTRMVELPNAWKLELFRPSLDDQTFTVGVLSSGEERELSTAGGVKRTPGGARMMVDHPRYAELAGIMQKPASEWTAEEDALFNEILAWTEADRTGGSLSSSMILHGEEASTTAAEDLDALAIERALDEQRRAREAEVEAVGRGEADPWGGKGL